MKLPKNESEWRAHDDAHRLLSAELIRKDPQRLVNAQAWLDELQAEAKNTVIATSKLSKLKSN